MRENYHIVTFYTGYAMLDPDKNMDCIIVARKDAAFFIERLLYASAYFSAHTVIISYSRRFTLWFVTHRMASEFVVYRQCSV